MNYILQTGCKLCKNGGIENYLLNMYRQIDKTNFQFIFVVENKEDDSYEDLIKSLGGMVYYVNGKNLLDRIINKYRIFREIDFKVAHIHVSCGIRAIDGIIVKIAKRNCKIIFHSHSNIGERPFKYSMLICVFRCLSSRLFACSVEAGQYFFGKSVINSEKFMVTKNAIDVNRFTFEIKKRLKIRKLHNIPDDVLLIGFIGRLSSEKNIPLFIDIISNLTNSNKRSICALIIGDGPDTNELKQLAASKKINHMVFTGNKTNIDEYMCALDCLILPSIHEALGIVLIEAQASSLLCFASDCVPLDTKITDNIFYFDIHSNLYTIISFINGVINHHEFKRINQSARLIQSGYDVEISVKLIEDVYYKLMED